MKLKVKLPKDVTALPYEVRAALLATLQKALNVVPPTVKKTEHNMWAPNSDGQLAQVEDAFYEQLITPAIRTMKDLFIALDLPIDDLEIEKAFNPDELQKSKNGALKHLLMSIKEGYKRSRALLDVAKQKGKAWTKKQLQLLDHILSEHYEDPADLVSEFMARVGFTAKLRQETDARGILPDRVEISTPFPPSIEDGERVGVTATVQDKRETITIDIPPFTEEEAEALKHAEAHCASKIQEVRDRQREQIKQVVIRAMKEHKSPRELAQELFDTFGDHSRDWRRVAITELAMAQNDAYLAGCEDGAKVYIPPVDGTCKYCKALIDGKTFIVSKVPAPDKEMTHVWTGKSNYGRKASEYVPCAPLHPHCRHRYHRVNPFYKFVDGKMVLKTHEEVMDEIRDKLNKMNASG